MSTWVLVTGATGFVGGHCIADLLSYGYDVRATVRDLAAAQTQLEHLVDLAARQGRRLEFAHADLGADAGWKEAVDGCEAIVHVASPVPLRHTEFIDLPQEGVLRVLTAAAASGSVRRVVVTSTTDAVIQGHAEVRYYTELDWSVPGASTPYTVGKTLAERAAWRFIDALPAGHQLELVTICPGMILGPVQRAATTVSHEPVKRLLNGTVPGSIRVGWATVDVRDLAVAHRLALETPSAAGQRYICAGRNVWMREIALVLAARYGAEWPVPTRELSDRMVRLVARFDQGMRLTLPSLGRPMLLSSEKARVQLGWEMRPVEDSILDTADSLVRHGLVRRPPAHHPYRRTRRVVVAMAGLRP